MAQLKFDKNAGISIPAERSIRDDIATAVRQIFQSKTGEPDINIEPTSPLGQIIDAFAAEVAAKNSEVAYLSGQSDLDSAEGRWLDALVSLYFLTRKVSEPTVVQCKVKGLRGTFIPYGAIVQDTTGYQYRHNVAGGCTIAANGEAQTTFSSVEHGAIEVLPHTVTKIVTVIPGWDSVDNVVGGVTGRVTETDSELRSRYRNSVAINSVGNVDTIRANVANLAGVIDCAVLENTGNIEQTQFGVAVPPHGICVCAFGGEDADIAQAIYLSKMGGTSMAGNYEVAFRDSEFSSIRYVYPIIRPVATGLFVRIELYADAMDAETIESIKNAVVLDALGNGAAARIGLAQTLYADRFRTAVYSASAAPVKTIAVALGAATGWADKLTINANVEPSITAENITVTLVGA